MIGRIHSILTTGMVDGPGVRAVVFMQGCLFRCKYCHNPDSWDLRSGRELESAELVNEILKLRYFIDKGKGGVTFSGGEPLLQMDFLIEVFSQLKKYDIHIAVDTNGFHATGTAKMEKLMSLIDLVLLDIKHIDIEKHKLLTGQEATLSHNMAIYLSKINKPTWIRYVVVPGWTTQVDYAEKLADFLSGMKNVECVQLLPFHQYGKSKWKDLGITYELEDTPALAESELADIRSVFESRGLSVRL